MLCNLQSFFLKMSEGTVSSRIWDVSWNLHQTWKLINLIFYFHVFTTLTYSSSVIVKNFSFRDTWPLFVHTCSLFAAKRDLMFPAGPSRHMRLFSPRFKGSVHSNHKKTLLTLPADIWNHTTKIMKSLSWFGWTGHSSGGSNPWSLSRWTLVCCFTDLSTENWQRSSYKARHRVAVRFVLTL